MLRGKTSLTPTNLRKSHFHSYRGLTKGGPAKDADYIFLKATYLRIKYPYPPLGVGEGGCSGQREGGLSLSYGPGGVCFRLVMLLCLDKLVVLFFVSLQYEQACNVQAYPPLWGGLQSLIVLLGLRGKSRTPWRSGGSRHVGGGGAVPEGSRLLRSQETQLKSRGKQRRGLPFKIKRSVLLFVLAFYNTGQ